LTILGFSSSPVIDGNVDRMVKAILEKSGKSTEFFNLSELSYGPCRACAHLVHIYVQETICANSMTI